MLDTVKATKLVLDKNERIAELEQENKKLKSDLAYERTMLDNVKAEYENLQEINENLKEELGKITVHSNMLESENRLLKEECKARLEKIKELEK